MYVSILGWITLVCGAILKNMAGPMLSHVSLLQHGVPVIMISAAVLQQ